MESKAKLFGHPVHPMLVAFPLGLLATSLVFDLIAAFGGPAELHVVAYWMILAGVIGGLAAAVPGFIDFFTIPRGTRAWSVGLLHGLGNLVVVALFAISWFLRREMPANPDNVAILLSFLAASIAVITGWLGGELVDRLGVGVDDGAHLDAPSSLSGRKATERHHSLPARGRP